MSPTTSSAVLPLEYWRSWNPRIPCRGIETVSPVQTAEVPRNERVRVTFRVIVDPESETSTPSTRSTDSPNLSPTRERPWSFRTTPMINPRSGTDSCNGMNVWHADWNPSNAAQRIAVVRRSRADLRRPLTMSSGTCVSS